MQRRIRRKRKPSKPVRGLYPPTSPQPDAIPRPTAWLKTQFEQLNERQYRQLEELDRLQSENDRNSREIDALDKAATALIIAAYSKKDE